jgi:preprotein translocase SecE subunit
VFAAASARPRESDTRMASETKTKENDKAMAANTTALASGGAEQPREPRPADRATGPAKPSFFTIYKKGQGKATRFGTAAAVALLGALIIWHVYRFVPAFVSQHDKLRAERIGIISAAVVAALYLFFAWRLMNKPGNVDFLIATDSEMKKVNWTSRKELIGSTKVVILFMFAIAIILFTLDLLFNSVFYFLKVLNVPWWKQIFGH